MQSAGTGVYYQAIPAVGPDGKNVMTLVPVRKVNGQFLRTQAPFRNDCQFGTPPHFSALPHAGFQTVRQGTDGSFVLQTPPTNSTFLSAMRGPQQTVNAVFLNTRPQIPIPVVSHIMTQNVPLLPPPPPPNQTPMIVLKRPQLPDAVKPPVHPDGHYLQVPSDATIRTLPVSALPVSIQNQIYSSSGVTSSSVKDPLTIRYVSPVSSVKLERHSPFHSNVGEGASSPAPAAVPYQRRVVQEPRAPYLIPVSSTNMSAEILKVVQQMETERRNQKTTSPSSHQEKVTPGNDNALVLCEGKVYFVAKKNAELIKEVVTNLGGESVTPSSTSSISSNANTSSKESSDIIDLCDDDEDEVSSSCPVSEEVRKEEPRDDDDANVIFVSYIPPKSSEPETDRNSGPTQTNTVASETKGSSMEMQPQCVKKGDVPTAEVKDRTDRTDCDGHSMNAEPEAPPPQPPQPEVHSNGGDVPQKTPPASDAELRQTFGIVYDLKVSLQRIKESKEVGTPAEKQLMCDKRTLEGIRKLLCGSKLENRIRSLIQKRVPSPKREGSSLQPAEVKRPKLDPGEDGTISDVTCERSGLSPESTEEPSTTSSPPSSTSQEPVHVPDAERPEKIPRHHSESPNTSDSQPQSDHVTWTSATKPADVKPSSVSQSTTACWSPAPVEPCSSLKNLRSDTPYKVEVEASPLMGRYSAPETYKLPSELFSSVVLDPEEIKRQERIKRLKDTLREKEAALERLRSGM